MIDLQTAAFIYLCIGAALCWLHMHFVSGVFTEAGGLAGLALVFVFVVIWPVSSLAFVCVIMEEKGIIQSNQARHAIADRHYRQHLQRRLGDIKRKTMMAEKDKPMHRMTPAQHAAMGWSHGQYKDGYCLAVMSNDTPEAVDEFRKEAEERGARYVALWNLAEYTG